MRFLFWTLVALLFTPLLHAAEGTPRNPLTPQEIAGGWLLLFDGETPFGWKIDGALVMVETETPEMNGSPAMAVWK